MINKAIYSSDSKHLHDNSLPAITADALGIILQNHIKLHCIFSIRGDKTDLLLLIILNTYPIFVYLDH